MKSKVKKLSAAIRSGKVSAVIAQLDAGVDPNSLDLSGEPLLNAAQKPEILEILLQRGGSPNVVPKYWLPPLHLAAANGRIRNAKILLENGAKVDFRDEGGNTPLMTAAARAQAEMVRLLLAAGAKVNLANAEGARAIHKVSASHSTAAGKIVDLLLQAGANPDSRDGRRATPLQIACYFRNLQVVQTLLAAGADVNARDEFGCTSLFSAIRFEDARIVALLLQKGADLSLRVSKRHSNQSICGRSLREIAASSSKTIRALVAE